MQPRVVVVGSYVQDLTWRCTSFPTTGETVTGAFTPGAGGKGSNQAIAAARAGAPTGLIAAVGDDAFARSARQVLRREGVTTRWALKEQPTGTAGILVDALGANRIVVALGANARLNRADLDPRLLARARVVVGQAESNLAATAQAFRLARQAGALTVLNPAPMRAGVGRTLLRLTDVLIPNETEFATLLQHVSPPDRPVPAAADLAGLGAEDLHRLCGRLGVPVVLVTLGARGCLLSRKDGYIEIPGHRVTVRDTTGAGDAFVGAFAAAVAAQPDDLAAAARFANAAGALATTRWGTAAAMPHRRQIEALMPAAAAGAGSTRPRRAGRTSRAAD